MNKESPNVSQNKSMGCINSSHDESQQESNKNIEKQLRVDAEKAMKEVKLLLLGAGECGKSTILKQMSIIHGEGYSEIERKKFIPIIYSNIIQSVVTILKAMEMLDLKLNEDLNSDKLLVIDQVKDVDNGVLRQDVVESIKKLWKNAEVQQCVQRAKEYNLNDSAEYYLNDIDRLRVDSYMPNDQDILRSRVKTTGIIESEFHFKDLDFKVYDVVIGKSMEKFAIRIHRGNNKNQESYEEETEPVDNHLIYALPLKNIPTDLARQIVDEHRISFTEKGLIPPFSIARDSTDTISWHGSKSWPIEVDREYPEDLPRYFVESPTDVPGRFKIFFTGIIPVEEFWSLRRFVLGPAPLETFTDSPYSPSAVVEMEIDDSYIDFIDLS